MSDLLAVCLFVVLSALFALALAWLRRRATGPTWFLASGAVLGVLGIGVVIGGGLALTVDVGAGLRHDVAVKTGLVMVWFGALLLWLGAEKADAR